MKLFVTALSLPALLVCAALGLATFGIYEGATHLLKSPPPRLSQVRATTPAFHLDQVVRVFARKNGLKRGFVKSIIAAESAFRLDAISPRGAIGLMQLMPETAREYGLNPYIPEQNIEGGTRYLKCLLNRYRKCDNQLERAIAAYNAGPGNVDKYDGIPPFPETQEYVKRVLTYYRQFEKKPEPASWKLARVRRARTQYGD